MKLTYGIFLRILILLTLFLCQSSQASDHASILIYHHVSDTTPESTSVTPAVFAQHMSYLHDNGFTVWPLGRILASLESKMALPRKTVAITFDDAYRSVLEQAAPILKRYDWPFTVFVSAQAINEGYLNYLSWDELRRLVAQGAEVGNHSYTHSHLIRHLPGESDTQWGARITADIQQGHQALHARLKVDTRLFSYPYGEYTTELQKRVGSLGYFGITQQSGAIGPGFDPLAIPRFPMATHFSGLKRLAVAANARPLPIRNIDIGAHLLTKGHTSKRRYAFDLEPGGYRLSGLACYSNDGTQLNINLTPAAEGLRASMKLPDWAAGVRKINCTAPSSTEKDVYYWVSQVWIVKQADGLWPDSQ